MSNSSRIRREQLALSPFSRHRLHKKCKLVEYSPFGLTRSCTAQLLVQITTTVKHCQALLPSVSLHHLFKLANTDRIETLIGQRFSLHTAVPDHQFYLDSNLKINQLRDVSKVLSSVVHIRGSLALCLKNHDVLPSNNVALTVIQNLKTLYECINHQRQSIETVLWKALDDYPDQTEARLRALMNQFDENPDAFEGRLPFIFYSNFRTLGAGHWLDDEIVNYFIRKWCTKAGTTLAFSTFFACRILFQQDSCIKARDGVLTEEDERKVQRWCRRATAGLKDWDRVFIPINENRTHWYSVCIDFCNKRIDIYDSLRDRCLVNRQKPILLRKNANLMLVLMWLAEVLGEIRGEDIRIKDIRSPWVCDPHSMVHFQPNNYDCGVHLLWHLQHVLEFRQVKLGKDCHYSQLEFTDNMVGKRLRLAQEIVDDIGSL